MRSVAIILGCAAFPGGFSEGVRRRLGEGECALSAAQLLTLPMDLLFCFSQSQGLDASTCIADRAYTLSTGCETCLFKAYGDACDCTDNPFSPACQLCSQTRATAALTSCVPEWDPRTQIPTSDEEQCSIADVATVASPAQFRTLVACLQAGRSTCWPAAMSDTCSGCLGTVVGEIEPTCTGTCLLEMAGAVLGRCLGAVAPPQSAACSTADSALFTQAQAETALLQCHVDHPATVDACVASSPLGALSGFCQSCLVGSPARSSDASCGSTCAVNQDTHEVVCAPLTPPCVVEVVDTTFCFDPNGMTAAGDDAVCSLAELVVIGTSFLEADLNACLSESVEVDAYKCIAELVGDSTACAQCVAATISVVAGCATLCESNPVAQTCQDCVTSAVTNAAGTCSSKDLPAFASDLIAKASGAPTWSLGIAAALVLSVL